MDAPKKLYWGRAEGGSNGPHDLLMADDAKYVGHFYEDASEDIDVEAVKRLTSTAPDMLAALRTIVDLQGKAASGLPLSEDETRAWSLANHAARTAIAAAEGR